MIPSSTPGQPVADPGGLLEGAPHVSAEQAEAASGLERLLGHGSARRAWLVGERGEGRAAVLSVLEASLRARGQVVARASAHPRGALAPFWPLARLAESLLGERLDGRMVDAGEGPGLLTPGERAGLRELARPTGLPGLPARPRLAAVAQALSRLARDRSSGGSLTWLLLDDVDRFDPASREALIRLSTSLDPRSTRLLLSTARAEDVLTGEAAVVLPSGSDGSLAGPEAGEPIEARDAAEPIEAAAEPIEAAAEPIEAAAERAAGAGEPVVEMVLLAQAAHEASERGDHRAAIEFLRRRLGRMRAEQMASDDPMLEQAAARAARELAEALCDEGRGAEATGVLREASALEVSPFERAARAFVSGRAARLRGRIDEAIGSFVEARSLLGEAGPPSPRARLLLALAEALLARGDVLRSGEALGELEELLEGRALGPVAAAPIALRVGQLWRDAGDERAAEALTRAAELGRIAHLPSIEGEALFALSELPAPAPDGWGEVLRVRGLACLDEAGDVARVEAAEAPASEPAMPSSSRAGAGMAVSVRAGLLEAGLPAPSARSGVVLRAPTGAKRAG